MSDVALLSFGCAVSFVVVAATYIFFREGFIRTAERQTVEVRAVEHVNENTRKVG